MARQRFIHPDLWEDGHVGSLTPAERLLFIALFSNADDDGRLVGDAANLRAIAFRFDDFSLAEVAAMRDHVAATMRHVLVYAVDGEEYIQLTSWDQRQHPQYRKPSRLPPPPPVAGPPVHGTFMEPSLKPVIAPAEDSSRVRTVDRDGLGSDRDREDPKHMVTPAAPPVTVRADGLQADFDRWWAGYPRKVDKHRAQKAYAAQRRAGLDADALLAARDHYVTATRGRPVDKIRHAATFLGPDVGEWLHGPPPGEVPRSAGGAWDTLRRNLADIETEEASHDA